MQRPISSLSMRGCTVFTYGQTCSYPLPSGQMPGKDSSEQLTPIGKTKREISMVRLLVPHWKTLFIGFASALGSVLADILQPVPVKIAIDNVLGGKPLKHWIAAWLSSPFGAGPAELL